MSKTKAIIEEFNPCVYPRLLWVAKGGSIDDLKESFELGDYEPQDGEGAVTLGSVRKAGDDRLGALVWFPNSGDMRHGDWIAHEATHVALYIYHEVGAVAEFENQEPFAYLVGWVFECVDKVRRMKHVSVESEPKDSEETVAQETCETKKNPCRNRRRWGLFSKDASK